MAAVEPPSPTVRCTHCQSIQIVKTQQLVTRDLYFCLGCGKSFERKTAS